MSFRRPTLRKVSKRVPKPKKRLRRLKRKSKKPSRTSKRLATRRINKTKKKKHLVYGVCFGGPNCTGKILRKRTTKGNCKLAGGKSWKSSRGCIKI